MKSAQQWAFVLAAPFVMTSCATTPTQSPEAVTKPAPAAIAQAPVPGSVEATLAAHPARMDALFAALDLTRPGLEPVAAALNKGDKAGAARALLAYYRTAPTAPWVRNDLKVHAPDYGDANDVALAAREAMGDTFSFQGVKGQAPRLPTGGLDWTHRGPRNDREWSLFLNRHFQFLPLMQDWQANQKPELAAKAGSLMVDWITNRPVELLADEKAMSSSWQPMSSASRLLQVWPNLFFGFQDSTDFSDEARLLMLSSVPEQARHLKTYHRKRHNHTIKEMSGLVHTAVVWPEFKEAKEWMDYGVSTLEGELSRQFYADGVHQELSAHYHRAALQYYIYVKDFTTAAGRPLPPTFASAIEKAADYLAMSMSPSGYGALNNNGDLDNNRELVLASATRFGRDDWRFIASNGASGSKPAQTSVFYPWAGQAFLRDGFGTDAQFAFFDVGPWGAAHQHNDKLNLTVSAFGRDLLVDGGRYRYTPDDPYVAYLRSSAGHNVLLVDGKGQGPDARLNEAAPTGAYASSPTVDFVQGAYTAGFPGIEGTAAHQRALVYVRGQHWIVIDRITTDRPRTISAHFRHSPAVTVVAEGQSSVSIDPGLGNLAITPAAKVPFALSVIRGKEAPEPMGWFSPDYNIRQAASVAKFEGKITRNTLFAWVLTPAKGAVNMPRVKVLSEDGTSIRLEVRQSGAPVQTLTVTLPDLIATTPQTARLVWANGNTSPQTLQLTAGETEK